MAKHPLNLTQLAKHLGVTRRHALRLASALPAELVLRDDGGYITHVWPAALPALDRRETTPGPKPAQSA